MPIFFTIPKPQLLFQNPIPYGSETPKMTWSQRLRAHLTCFTWRKLWRLVLNLTSTRHKKATLLLYITPIFLVVEYRGFASSFWQNLDQSCIEISPRFANSSVKIGISPVKRSKLVMQPSESINVVLRSVPVDLSSLSNEFYT